MQTLTGFNRQGVQIAARLGYNYIGLTRSSTLHQPEALIDHILTHKIELVVIPDITHLRGRIPPDLGDLVDIHDLATDTTYERPHGYRALLAETPETSIENPLP
jgi:hypothetical protein